MMLLCLGLVYDTAMSKHQCLCGDNQNHVEHGGRVHSIWARLQECGLVDVCERVAAKKASVDILKLVHTNTYSTFFGVSPAACMKIDAQDIPIKKFNQVRELYIINTVLLILYLHHFVFSLNVEVSE